MVEVILTSDLKQMPGPTETHPHKELAENEVKDKINQESSGWETTEEEEVDVIEETNARVDHKKTAADLARSLPDDASWAKGQHPKNRPAPTKKHPLSVTITKDNKRKVTNSGHPPGTVFIGMKRVPGTMLYLRDVYRDNKSDEELVQNIKEYAKSYGLRVMFAEVRRNRYCEDIVGIKIKVPVSQEEIASDDDFWPNDVTVKKWEPYHSFKKNSQFWDGYDDYSEKDQKKRYQ